MAINGPMNPSRDQRDTPKHLTKSLFLLLLLLLSALSHSNIKRHYTALTSVIMEYYSRGSKWVACC